MDRERKIDSATQDMKTDLSIENNTDARANEVALLQVKINELLQATNAQLTLSRTGNVIYNQNTDEDFEAHFFITSLNYFVLDNGVKAECKSGDCVSIIKQGFISDETREFDSIVLNVENSEQGDRLIEYLKQYETISNTDATIDKGIKRRGKRLIDKIQRLFL